MNLMNQETPGKEVLTLSFVSITVLDDAIGIYEQI